MQGRDILESAIFSSPVDKSLVLNRLHAIKEAVVACHKAAEQLSEHLAAAQARWRTHPAGEGRVRGVVTSLPQIPDLELTVTQFLISAKRAIGTICGLAPLFLPLDRTDSNFDHLGKRVAAVLGPEAPLMKFIHEYADSARYLIELRNGQEHPTPETATHVQNVRVQPNGSVAAPLWFVTGAVPRPIHLEATAAVERMIEMAELMLIHLVDECLDTRWPFLIQALQETERDPNLPIRYKLSVDISRLRLGE